MEVKFENGKYYALADYTGEDRLVLFWDQLEAKNLFGKIEVIEIPNDVDYEGGAKFKDKSIYFTNCGTAFMYPGAKSWTPCSGLWPNLLCPNCGGIGIGATINNSY